MTNVLLSGNFHSHLTKFYRKVAQLTSVSASGVMIVSRWWCHVSIKFSSALWKNSEAFLFLMIDASTTRLLLDCFDQGLDSKFATHLDRLVHAEQNHLQLRLEFFYTSSLTTKALIFAVSSWRLEGQINFNTMNWFLCLALAVSFPASTFLFT